MLLQRTASLQAVTASQATQTASCLHQAILTQSTPLSVMASQHRSVSTYMVFHYLVQRIVCLYYDVIACRGHSEDWGQVSKIFYLN